MPMRYQAALHPEILEKLLLNRLLQTAVDCIPQGRFVLGRIQNDFNLFEFHQHTTDGFAIQLTLFLGLREL